MWDYQCVSWLLVEGVFGELVEVAISGDVCYGSVVLLCAEE